jgi:TolB-like protein/DNA-binding winged helix-turn-helix (wHTH) protein/Tfp pilus assembly protein PilF
VVSQQIKLIEKVTGEVRQGKIRLMRALRHIIVVGMEPIQHRTSEESVIRFGAFELALKSGELRKEGNVVRLQMQPLKALAYLASHAGQTVTREELQQAVWGNETFVDFEHGLNFCIKQIRAALGDNAQAPRFIETLPRRGYRFIAQIEPVNGLPVVKAAQEPVAAALEPQAPIPTRSRTYRFVLASIAAMALAAAGYFLWRSFNTPAPPKAKMMLAVLRFANLSLESEQGYFSDGLTEEMIARLGRLQPQRLGVIARTSAMAYKGVNKDVSTIARELGVAYILEGSVRRDGDRVRITAQLIRADDRTHLWSESYDRSLRDALSVQSEVAAQIASTLAIELLGDRNNGASHSTNAEAVDAYLRGRYLLNKGDPENVGKSVAYFKRAIEKDAGYAAGFAGLADAYRLLGMYYSRPPAEAYPQAKTAAQRALELDPGNAEALVALGTIRFRYEWEWEKAERDFLRALEINPSLGMAHHDYAWFLLAKKRLDEGIEHIKTSQRLDPLSPLANSDVGWVYLMARRYDEAIEQIKRTLELEPRFGSALACLERAYLLKGQHKEALEILLKTTGQASASVRDDAPEQAINALHRLRLKRRLEAMKTTPSSAYNVATLCAAAGEAAQAMEWLETAFQERDPMLVAVSTDPAFDSLRGEARFQRLLKRIGFPT